MTNNITPASQKKNGCLNLALGIFGGFIGLSFLIGALSTCSGHKSVSNDSAAASSSSSGTLSTLAAVPEASVEPTSQWNYASDEDAMTGKMTKTARVISTNTLNLDFPYNGAQNGYLTIRNHPQYGHDVIVRIERGQLLCDISDGCTLMVRFDDDAPQAFTALEPADNSSESLFISNYKRFTTRLKTAKRVRIQLNIYQEGAQYLEFDTTGFDPSKL